MCMRPFCLSMFVLGSLLFCFFFFFFNDPAPTDIYTLSLHDALPISMGGLDVWGNCVQIVVYRIAGPDRPGRPTPGGSGQSRSEEHTSELQSHSDLVCRLLLEKKKKNKNENENCRTIE